MKLDELLRSCFDENGCRMFLVDNLDVDGSTAGTDAWDSTQGPWKDRAFDLAEELERMGLVRRQFFEALLRELPNRADDIAAGCRTATGEPLNYAVGQPPATEAFPWSDYQRGMSPGLVQLLRYAAYDARSRGFTTVSTSEIVRVYVELQPWVAASVVTDPGERLAIEGELDLFEDGLGASTCVAKTVHGLATFTENPAKFTEHDVFLDLVRFGNGTSARKLAPNGDALDAVNELSRRLGIGRITRHGVLDEPPAAPAP
jgi:hypothetical protein